MLRQGAPRARASAVADPRRIDEQMNVEPNPRPADRWATVAAAGAVPEQDAVRTRLAEIPLDAAGRGRVVAHARQLVAGCRRRARERSVLDLFLQEFGLSNEEGVALLCISEALLRIPDDATAEELIAEKIATGNWATHLGRSESVFLNASTWALMLTGEIITLGEDVTGDVRRWIGRLVGRVGEIVSRAAMARAVRILAGEFVRGRTIEEALAKGRGELASYDMLGEGGPHLRRRGALRRRLSPRDPRRRRRKPRFGSARLGRVRRVHQTVRAASAPRAAAAGPRTRRTRPVAASSWPVKPRPPISLSPSTPRRPNAWSSRWSCSRDLRATRICGRGRLGAGRASLLAAGSRGDRLAGWPRPAIDGALGQRRVLGRRGETRPSGRFGGLSGPHAQSVHRRRLHRLRGAPVARDQPAPAIRHPQRPHRGGRAGAGGTDGCRMRVSAFARLWADCCTTKRGGADW